MQTEVSTDSLYKSTRRFALGRRSVSYCLQRLFQTHTNKTVGSNTLFGNDRLQTDENVIQYALYDILL